jgi:hypothetical protein
LQFGAVGAIDVFVQAVNGDACGGDRPSRELPRESQPPSDTAIEASAGVQHWKRQPAEEPPLDDGVSGLWRDP